MGMTAAEMEWRWGQNVKILLGRSGDGDDNHGDEWGRGRKCVPV